MPTPETTPPLEPIEALDWWFDGICAWRHGFEREVPERVPPGEPTDKWLQGWDDGDQNG